MKKIMTYVAVASLVAIVSVNAAQVLNKRPDQKEPVVNENASKVTEYKKKSRESLKPYRYDACNVTYYSYTGFEQKRVFEIMMFNGTEYKLNFNTEGSPKPITIQIYDKPETNQARVKLYEQSNVQGGDVNVITADIIAKYREILKEKYKDAKVKPDTENATLKRLYIDYIIPANDSKEPLKGFAVMSYGYKNI